MAQARAGSEKSSERQTPGRGQAVQAKEYGSQQSGGREGSEQQNRQSISQQGRQQGQEGSGEGSQSRSESINMATGALRSLGQFYDMQAATARIMLRAQIRAASAFGLPDYSRMFQVEDDRANRLFSAATDNLVQFVNQEKEVFNEVPAQVYRLFEKQAIDVTERWKHGLKEFQQQATQSLEELKELSRQQAEEISRATEMFTEASTASMRESGEEFRNAARQGREAMSQQGRDTMSQGREAMNQGREAMNQQGREAINRGREAMNQQADEVESSMREQQGRQGKEASSEQGSESEARRRAA